MRYVVRLWLITVLLSPILWVAALITLGIIHLENLPSTTEGLFPLLYLGGLLVALPVFCAFYLFYSMITQQETSVRYKKILLSVIAVILVAITFLIIDNSIYSSWNRVTLLMLSSYVATFAGGIWVFRLA